MHSVWIRTYLVAFVILITAISCSSNADDAVYDLTSNPSGFPPAAVTLLEKINTGEPASYESIVDAFGQLYVGHSELLDNAEWQDVINRQGLEFFRRAGELALEGVEQYTQAAGFYKLASFAQPTDKEFKQMCQLFDVWRQGIRDPNLAVYKDAKGRDNLAYQIDQVKRYLFGSELEAEFARKYLVEQTVVSIAKREPDLVAELTPADLAFAASLGAAEFPESDVVISFGDPRCDLVTYELVAITADGFRVDDSFRVEVYFIPQEKIETDYTVAFWLNMGETAEAGHLPFDFTPALPSSEWKTGKVHVAAHNFSYDGDFSSLSFGLYSDRDNTALFLSIDGTDEMMVRVPTVR